MNFSLKFRVDSLGTYSCRCRICPLEFFTVYRLTNNKKIQAANATGAPNDGFLQNTLKTLFRLSRVLLVFLEIHSNRRYNIHISSVILRQLESFRNYQGFRIIFPKILDGI